MLDINKLIAIVKADGEKLQTVKMSKDLISSKEGHQNFVTEYDKKSQNFLETEFAKYWPEYAFIAEEKSIQEQLTDAPAFIVDPIDGTSNFIFGIPNSAISVAVVENKETVQAVVYNFFQDEMFYAEKGKGAYLNGEKISVNNLSLEDSLFVVGTAAYYPELQKGTASLMEQLLPLTVDLRRFGAAALDLCYVACGRCNGFAELRLQVWDYAAGYLIAKEAGAVATDFYGNELYPKGETNIIVANPKTYKDFFAKLDLQKVLA